MMMRRRLACFTRDMRGMSNDFDEQERVTTYDGLESCIMNSNSYDNESGTSNGCVTDSFDEDDSSCSSSANALGSFSSISISVPPMWTTFKKDEEEWKHATCHSDVEAMKDKFAKLLLGDDVTGGARGVSSALALSNAITNLAASVFGELEPLPEERKRKWRREMDWFLTPTNYMVELIPAKQNHPNGRTMEIMTPKARADIHMNLPALKKLDSMLIDTLESMVDTEFWYAELGSRAEGRSTRWWLPSPRVPARGLSEIERKRLLHIGKHIHQVFKAAKSINEHILAEMPIPSTIKDALPKSGRANLGEELYKILTAESLSIEDMMSCLNLKSEHSALQAVNRLEAAVFTWRERIAEQGSKSPVRASSWSFVRDHMSELEKREALVKQAELLLLQLKIKYPNLPQTFLDVTRIQYGKDVGHAILEAYSRVVANVAFSILSRLGDILQEDIMSNPKSPVAMSNLVGARIPGISDSPMLDRVRHSLLRQLNSVDVKSREATEVSDHEEGKISSL